MTNMTMTINFHEPRFSSYSQWCLTWPMRWLIGLVSFCVFFAEVSAENVLQDISYSALPGGNVELTMKFSETVSEPKVFTTENPPRIALDLADTRNGMAITQRRLEIGTGATSSVSAVEAAGRTRVVVDLFRSTTYEKRIEGDKLVLTISNAAGGLAVASSAATTDPTKSVANSNLEIANIDFRRGKNGEGRIVVVFSDEGGTADLKREGDKIVLDMPGAKLSTSLAQRLDVLDFATPVQFIDTRPRGTGARMEIVANGAFEQLAYQSGNEYVVEISPVRETAVDKKEKNEPQYSGNVVNFNFQDIPVRGVLELIAQVSEFNVVVADSVQGSVTLRLVNVPWDQALDIILQAKGLDKRKQGNVIWVAPQKEIAERETVIEDGKRRQEKLTELVSDYISISYAKASAIAALISKGTGAAAPAASSGSSASTPAPAAPATVSPQGFLSERGSVTFDERTNTLLVNDTPDKIKEIRSLIALLDRPVQQVLIESRIVIASENFSKELGARFGVSGGYEDKYGNVVTTAGTSVATDGMSNQAVYNHLTGNRAFPVIVTSTSNTGGGAIGSPKLADRLNINMPAASPAGSFGLAILGADYLLDLELSAAQKEGRSEVISSPRVITASQQEAVIKQGKEVGYVTSSGGANSQATVSFKEAVLELKVTPTITADRRVSLTLAVKKDAIAQYIPVPGGGLVPSLDKREINTSVLVNNGQTVVLGGIYEISSNDDLKKVPFLGDVPGIGALFRNTNKKKDKAELLIFVTPRILDESLK